VKHTEEGVVMLRVPNILHVDDNEGDLELLEFAFKAHGYPVSISNALNADQAFGLLEIAVRTDVLPDLVLLDLNIPRIQGTEVLKFIRHHEKFKTTPTIILTSSDSGVDRRRCHMLGANDYIVKPFRLDDYVLLIERLLPFIHISPQPT
jgi:DNA-binding response OmpR family regulator